MKRKEEKEKAETEWVLCTEDWRDNVIMYVPNLNDIPIEENYAEIPIRQIKKAYKQYQRITQKKITDEEK